MNKILTIALTAIIGAALAVPAMAQEAGPKNGGKPGQGQGGPGGPGGRRMMMGGGMMGKQGKEIQQKVLGQLGLSAAQKEKIKALDAKTEKEMKAFMDQQKATRDKNKGERPTQAQMKAMMEKVQKIQADHKKGMDGILTAAQRTKYDQLMKSEMEKARKEWEKNRQKNGGQRPGGQPGRPAGAKPGTGGGKPK